MTTTVPPNTASPDAAAPRYTAFAAGAQLAAGALSEVAAAVKAAHDAQPERDARPDQALLVFDDRTGRVIDLDLRGTVGDVIARLPAIVASASTPSGSGVAAGPETVDGTETPSAPRGRGRPKLGVVAREVTLLPQHWAWLADQPGGASVTLRKLVHQAQKASSAADALRVARERAYRVMTTLAGHQSGFEEASRALFAGDASAFQQHSAAWPADVAAYVSRLLQPEP